MTCFMVRTMKVPIVTPPYTSIALYGHNPAACAHRSGCSLVVGGEGEVGGGGVTDNLDLDFAKCACGVEAYPRP